MIPTKKEWDAALEQRYGREIREKLAAAAVAVCGLGGLGSNIAIALARVGVGKLILIDFDRVDITNLHRQQYKATQIGRYKAEALAENLREIAPYIELETYAVRIEEETAKTLLEKADVICEAFDDAEYKAMLADTVLGSMAGKYLVAASGMAGFGSANAVKTRKITEHFYLCGDEVSSIEENMCLVASRVMLCAAHQAHAVLQILTDQQEV